MASWHFEMAASTASKFLGILKVLTTHEVDFIIVGGVAGVLAGAPLVTFDIDIVFDLSPANIERLLTVLHELNAHYRDPAGRTLQPDAVKLETLRMNLFDTDLGELDVLRSIGHDLMYSDLLTRSHDYHVSGLRVRAIDLPTLIEAKEIAGRPKDHQALLFLRETLAMMSSETPETRDES